MSIEGYKTPFQNTILQSSPDFDFESTPDSGYDTVSPETGLQSLTNKFRFQGGLMYLLHKTSGWAAEWIQRADTTATSTAEVFTTFYSNCNPNNVARLSELLWGENENRFRNGKAPEVREFVEQLFVEIGVN